jgi:hypothetical protein
MESKLLGDSCLMLSEMQQESLYIYLSSAPEVKRMERASWLLAQCHLPRSTPYLMRLCGEAAHTRMELAL